MSENNKINSTKNFNGVMLNAYPDSIGAKLSDTISMLKKPAFKDVFSLFYVLPTFFNSDLDRGFSIIDYNLNENLVGEKDLEALKELDIVLKFDIVLNHLSVASPQFKDILAHGEKSKYKDFFINWNHFWENNGHVNEDGIIIPEEAHLSKLFMRKPGLPILKVVFPDGSEQPYWNTFYKQITYTELTVASLKNIKELSANTAILICKKINEAISKGEDFSNLPLPVSTSIKEEIVKIVKTSSTYLGQMDVNAASNLVWEFYEETFSKLKKYGCKILRLDAFAYLHKEIGETNFFNKPGTWEYLARIKEIAARNELQLLPEIHAEYGLNLHDEVAEKGYHIYDFFLPGLMLHTLETANSSALVSWIQEIIAKEYKTVNMLGCHDGIPVLDLKGKEVNGVYKKGLLADSEIDAIMDAILKRGGRVKNLYDAEGKKISYYQVNATFFSALGESESKLLLARAIQLFIPGIPQVWYLDLFAGKNNYAAADKGGSGGHKEINRTNLKMEEIEEQLTTSIVKNQLTLMRLRNTLNAFSGTVHVENSTENELEITWTCGTDFARLKANLTTAEFFIEYSELGTLKKLSFQ